MRDLIQRLLDAVDQQPHTLTKDGWIAAGYVAALRDQVEAEMAMDPRGV